jgi:ADP-ribose pyrophosphatase YjhB (NUDIX family)
MSKVARAIILQNNKILLMRRNKQNGDYYTLIGGPIKEGESPEQAIVREVKEESSLDVTNARLVFIEEHPAPYNEQLIFLCNIVPREEVAIQAFTEEAKLNKLDYNTHEPLWIEMNLFPQLPFLTTQLQNAIHKSLSAGFPDEPVKL